MAVPHSILFLITDLDLGGSPLMLRALARGLKSRGAFRPIVVSLKPAGEVAEMLAADGVEVRSLELRSVLQFPRGLVRLRRLLAEFQPEIVHSILFHANILAALVRPLAISLEKPYIHIQSIHTLQERPRWHWAVGRFANAAASALGRGPIHVAPSPEILLKITGEKQHTGGKSSKSRRFCVPNGIDIERFHLAPPLPTSALPWPPGSRVLGYLGRFDPVKNLPMLIAAAADIIQSKSVLGKELHLAMVGWGPLDDTLRCQVRLLGIVDRVHFPGPTNIPEQWYKSFNALCLPSESEGFGLALLEGLSAGLPVIAGDIPTLRRVGGVDAHFVHPLNVNTLSIAIKEVMLAPRSSEAALAARLVRLTADYSEEAMVERYERIFKDFLT